MPEVVEVEKMRERMIRCALARFTERVYLAAAIRGLALVPAMFPEAGDDELLQHLLRFAEDTLGRRRRRTRETRLEPTP